MKRGDTVKVSRIAGPRMLVREVTVVAPGGEQRAMVSTFWFDRGEELRRGTFWMDVLEVTEEGP